MRCSKDSRNSPEAVMAGPSKDNRKSPEAARVRCSNDSRNSPDVAMAGPGKESWHSELDNRKKVECLSNAMSLQQIKSGASAPVIFCTHCLETLTCMATSVTTQICAVVSEDHEH